MNINKNSACIYKSEVNYQCTTTNIKKITQNKELKYHIRIWPGSFLY